jgi:cell division protease FtsH
LAAPQDQAFLASETTGREIDLAVRDLLDAGLASAGAILERHRPELEAGVRLLLSKETLTAEEFAPLRSVPKAA